MPIPVHQDLEDVMEYDKNVNRLWASGAWCTVVMRTALCTGKGSEKDGEARAPHHLGPTHIAGGTCHEWATVKRLTERLSLALTLIWAISTGLTNCLHSCSGNSNDFLNILTYQKRKKRKKKKEKKKEKQKQKKEEEEEEQKENWGEK